MKIPDIDPQIRIESLEDANKYLQRKLLLEQERLAATDRRVIWLEDNLEKFKHLEEYLIMESKLTNYKIIQLAIKIEKFYKKLKERVKSYALRNF